MISLLKAEWIQLRTTRTAVIWGIIVLILTLLPPIAFLIYAPQRINLDELAHMRTLDLILLVFSVVAVSGNYRHKVAITEQLIAPTIWQTLLCKLVTFGLFGALVVAAQIAIVAGLMVIWPGASLHAAWSDLGVIGLAVFGGAMSAMFGVALARLVRVQVAAVLVAIAYFALIEPSAILALMQFAKPLHDWIEPMLPGAAFRNLMGHGEASGIIAAAAILTWITGLSFFSYLLDRKRD